MMGFIYLKPCPFCGNDQLSVMGDTPVDAFVVCPFCGARGPVAYRNHLSEDAMTVQAMRKWDRRADG